MRGAGVSCVYLVSIQVVLVLTQPVGHPGLPWYVHKEHLVHRFHNKANEVRRATAHQLIVHDDNRPFVFVSNETEVDPELKLPAAELSDAVDYFTGSPEMVNPDEHSHQDHH
ncbi:unnamed protein product [Dicrocoelium dendriticum]|nr:unnamed protein product [Dicrocoelium dendriticum]